MILLFRSTALAHADFSVTIDGRDRFRNVERSSIRIVDDYNEQPNTATFECFGFTPTLGQLVTIRTYDQATGQFSRKEFRGTITRRKKAFDRKNDRLVWHVTAIDGTYQAAAALITKSYGSQSATAIALDLMASAPSGFTTTNVVAALPTVPAIQFKMTTLPDALSQLCDAFGGGWYFDEDNDLHLFVTDTSETPDTINSATVANVRNFGWNEHIEAVVNRILVEGMGTSAERDTAVGSTVVTIDASDMFSASGGDAITGNQQFVYTGIGKSYTPNEWESETGIDGSSLWLSVAWAPSLGLLCAVATGGQVMTSPDGITWTTRTAPEANLWRDVCWSPGLALFVAVAASGTNRVMTSPDGIAWTARSAAAANQWYGVTWAPSLSLFAAVSIDGANRVMTSPDGSAWTSRSAASALQWRKLAWAPSLSLFCAVAADAVSTSVMTSPDGTVWTSRTPAVSAASWADITWSPERSLFVATSTGGYGTTPVMTSPNGTAWTARAVEGTNAWESVAWGAEAGMFVGVSRNGTNRVMSSSDGLTWAVESSPSADWYGVAWASTVGFIAVGTAGSVMKSGGPDVLTGIPSSGTGSIQYAITKGDQVNLLVQRDDLTSQATYGIRQKPVQDRRLSIAGAQTRGDAELVIGKDPRVTGSFISTDAKLKSGRPITISMNAEWGVNATYTITRVEKSFALDRPLMQRRVDFSSVSIDRDLLSIMRGLRRAIREAA